ncbi:MAG: hypothetical protein CL912_00445 [Deltaproteobacteria bacterium]|nr:hypothetical protein [Deltaproteobacteria bacterium]
MRFQPLIAGLSGLLATSSATSLEVKRDTCPAGSVPVEVLITTQVYLFQVNINTFIQDNTIININGGK